MALTLLTILALALVIAVGAGFVAFIASLPSSMLKRAQEHGRFAGLGLDTPAGPGRSVRAGPASRPARVTIVHAT